MTLHKLFTYGILQGYGTLLVPHYVLPGAYMYDLGAFPGITHVDKSTNFAVGNIIEIGSETLAEFDRIEGVPNLYRREKIQTYVGETWIYLFNGDVSNCKQINQWRDDYGIAKSTD